MKTNIKYAELAMQVNLAKTATEHVAKLLYLHAWRDGVTDAGKYISDHLADEASRDSKKRPMKAGLWLDWSASE